MSKYYSNVINKLLLFIKIQHLKRKQQLFPDSTTIITFQSKNHFSRIVYQYKPWKVDQLMRLLQIPIYVFSLSKIYYHSLTVCFLVCIYLDLITM